MSNVKTIGPSLVAADIQGNDQNIDNDLQAFKSTTNTSLGNQSTTITSAQANIATLQTQMTTAQTNVTQANVAANAAQATANSAVTTANSASSTANSAQTQANTTQTNLTNHTSAASGAHAATAVTETRVGNVQSALSDLNTRMSNVIGQAGTSNTEIVNSRTSTIDNTTYNTLTDRLNQMDTKTAQSVLELIGADMVRKAVNSGVVDYVGGVFNGGIVVDTPAYSRGEISVPSSSQFATYQNQAGLSSSSVYVNGYKVDVVGSNTPAGGHNVNLAQLDAPPTANVTPSLPGSARDDLVFVEVWKAWVAAGSTLYNYGGVNSGSTVAATGQYQWQWRIRVVDGVDFGTYSEGMKRIPNSWDGKVTPQGGNAAPVAYNGSSTSTQIQTNFHQADTNLLSFGENLQATSDSGLYVAGDGSATAKTLLNTVDGYVYAIPLFRVRRRNNAAYDPDNNPLGGRQYVSFSFSAQNAGTWTLGNNYECTVSSTSNLVAGSNIYSNGVFIGQIVSIDSATTFSFKNLYWTSLTVTAGQVIASSASLGSDRPDGLYSNIIDATDIVDLRHQVSLTGFNYQALLEKNLDLLLRGQLNTSDTPRYAREYVGLNTSSYTDDVNSLLYLKFDGSMAGTANGTAVANTKVGSGTEAYKNGVQGLSADFSAGNYGEQYAINIPATGWTVDGFFKQNWIGNSSVEYDLVNAYSGTPSTTNRTITIFAAAAGFVADIWDGSQGQHFVSIDMSKSKAGDIHCFKVTYDGTTLKLQLDEQTATLAYTGGVASSYVQVGYYGPGNGFGFSGQTDLLRISNIVRSGTPLPTGFSFANGDRILDGPMGDFPYLSDEVGGTAGVNGRTNPYGLSRVPNQVAARVGYNGSEIRHYYGQGYTPGGVATNFGVTPPTGSFENNGETFTVTANEIADGTKTTFTFNKPVNMNVNSIFAISYANSVGVGSATSWVTPSSMTYNPSTGLVTVVLSSAPTSGQSVTLYYGSAQRHAHLVPSTKGFVVHDWTDDALTGNGTLTTFQTTKYNVTSMNHVRVAGAIQSSGVTTSGLNAATTLTAQAVAAATTITVASGANFVNGQNIRVSKGDGTWYTTTVSSGGGTTTLTIPAIPAGTTLPQNATVQGAALVTLTTAPANGATVDLVYESVLTPSLGDYIRIAYQHTPYQGTLNTNLLTALYTPKELRATSMGTGKYFSTSGIYTYPMSTQLPIGSGVNDYSLKGDALYSSVFSTGRGGDYWMESVPASAGSVSTGYYGIRPGYQGSLSSSYKTARGTGFMSGVGSIDWWSVPLTVGVPHVNVYAFLAMDSTTNEMYLVVATLQIANTNMYMSVDGSNSCAVDTFKLQGRPLLKAYGGVTA